MVERIKEAAIRKDGKVYTGRRHHNILHAAPDYGLGRGGLKNGEQGFVTESGRFVDRTEGAKLALESGQIPKLNWPPNLYSEDLY